MKKDNTNLAGGSKDESEIDDEATSPTVLHSHHPVAQQNSTEEDHKDMNILLFSSVCVRPSA